MHLAKEASDVSVKSDLMYAQRNVDDGVHEKTEVSEIAFVELNSHF
jgi:hypothetical protein